MSFVLLAILQLSDAIDLRKESKGRLCLPSIDHPVRPGMDCYVAGWGKTSKDTRYTSETLQHAKMKLIDRDTCNLPGMISGGGLKEREICAGYRDLRADICPGDSGGSLVCQLNGKILDSISNKVLQTVKLIICKMNESSEVVTL